MLKLSEIKKVFADRKWNLSQVAREIKLPYGALYRTLRTKRPSYVIVELISDYLESIGVQK